MAPEKHFPNATLSAKRAIFNNLCAAYRRSRSHGLVTADEVSRKLQMPQPLFDEALNSFIRAENQMAVEVLEIRGGTYLRLSHTVIELCADWGLPQKRELTSKPAHPVTVPHEHIVPRSIR